MPYLLTALLGYSLGCINPAYIIARIKGFDIHERGSKNPGASNALITMGKRCGFLCAAFDIAKAALAVWLSEGLFPAVDTFAVAAASCILGHMLPFYLRFRGGKGLACLCGSILAFDLRVFGILLACETVLLLTTKYICYVPITASAVLPWIYGSMRRDLWGALLLGSVFVVILCKHLENLRRIREGRELRVTYLWDREKEARRLGKFYSGEEDI